ncbi:MAG TPA: extracellular solute-binding protein [Promineifilum sp.]|nr:extracellular solute-binding protein [Promineifilum sp.]
MTKTIILLISLLLLVACGAPNTEIRPTPIDLAGGQGGGAADEGGGVGHTVSLRLWAPNDDARNAAYQALIVAYTNTHPDVSIQLETFDPTAYAQTLQSALASGGAADIIQLPGSACPWAAAGVLGEVPAAVLNPTDAATRVAVAGSLCDNRLYSLPQTVTLPAAAALVDRAAAEAAGLTGIAGGWATWDELLADARALAVVQDGVMTRAGFHFIDPEALPALFFGLILQNGGQPATNGIVTANTPQGAAALALLKRFVDEGAIDPQRFNDATDPLARSALEGRSAMSVAPPGVAAQWNAAHPDAPALYLPLPWAGAPAVAAPGWALAVTNLSAAPEVAWDFARFVALEPANAAQWSQAAGALPALLANREGEAVAQLAAAQPALAPLLPLLPAATDAGLGAGHDRLWREVAYPRLLAYLQGAATAEETLTGIDAAASAPAP